MEKRLPFYQVWPATRKSALSIALLFCTMVSYSQLQLLKDINTAYETNYLPYYDLKAGVSQFFFVSNGSLFVSKGSLATTRKVGSFKGITSLTMFDNVAYFAADDGNGRGRELWKSNGLTTIRMTDINPGEANTDIDEITIVSPTLIFFKAYSQTYGWEVWKTTGNESGTRLVKDIIKGKGSSNPAHLTKVGSLIYFTANDGQHGYELWKSDGTEAGTILVKDIQPDPRVSSNPKHLTDVNGTLFFGATLAGYNFEVWKSDGTAAGTVMVKDIRPGNGNSEAENFINVNGTLFFTAHDGVHGDELWKSDGTETGTVLVKDLNPGPGGSNTSSMWTYPMTAFSNVNGILYFWASRGYSNFYVRSDGTEEGTYRFTDARAPGLNEPQPNFTYLNGFVYFFNEGANGYGLYRADSTSQNVTFIKAYNKTEDFYERFETKMIRMGSNLYATALTTGAWTIVKQSPTGPQTVLHKVEYGTVGSWPSRFEQAGDKMYFVVENEWPGEGSYLYRTDGSPEGTVELSVADYYTQLKAIGDKLFFTVSDRLYVTYPSSDSIIAIPSQPVWTGNIINLMDVNGILYLSTNDGEVWKTDGTDAGTVKVRTLNKVTSMTSAGGRGYITNETATGGLELWRTNATGLLRVKVIREGVGRPSEYTLRAGAGSIFYFTADDGVHGNEVWRSDGTAFGTFMIKDLNTIDSARWGNTESDIRSFAVFNNKLYFSAADENNDWKYYVVSGRNTIAEVAQVGPVTYTMQHNGKLYLFAQQGPLNFDMTLWVTNGTPGNLQMFADIDSHNRVDYAVVNNVLYFNFESDRLFQVNDCGIVPVDEGRVYAYGIEAFGDHLILSSWGNTNTGIEPHIYYNIADNAVICTMSTARVSTEEEFTPWPNPYTAAFTMRIPGGEGELANVQVYNATGFPVETFNGISTNTDYDNIGNNWPKGTYFVRVTKGEKVSIHRVIKK